MQKGLDDLSVIEIGTTVVAPYTSQILAALGADVVKVERPGGDPFRNAGLKTDAGISGYFSMCNCEKESISIDLKTNEGKDILLTLAEEADVIIENNRPGVVDKLGIGYEDVKKVSENIIYCSISGFGQEGPLSEHPGFDPIIQGMAGLMAVTGEKDEPPVRIGVAIVDLMTATWSAIAILNSLRYRDRTGKGEYIDMSMYDVGVSTLTKKASHYLITGENPKRMGTEDEWAAPYGAYPTKDNRYLMIGTPWQDLWEKLCKLIDRPDLLKNELFDTERKRIVNRDKLNNELKETFKQKTLDQWVDIIQNKIPAGPIMTVEESLTHEQTDHAGIIKKFDDGLEVLNLPMKTQSGRHTFEQPPPFYPSEDAVEILKRADFSDEKINEFIEQGVVEANEI